MLFQYEPLDRPRKVKMVKGRSPERRLEAAQKHITKRWLPVNELLLSRVQERLEDGTYLNNREGLIEDIKNDPALYLYCSRNAAHLTDRIDTGLNPLEVLKQVDAAKLKTFFTVASSDISAHELKSMSQQQALSLQASLFSTKAAEAIAQQSKIPPDLAFSTAYFRQLGLHLVAWNYPKIYAEALSAHRRRKSDVEIELAEYLGVTPAEIAARFATEWSIAPDIRNVLLTRSEMEKDGSKKMLDLSPLRRGEPDLLQLCQVAELYSQLKDPINYPLAETEWAQNLEFIEERFPLHVLDAIDDKVQDVIGYYADSGAVLGLPVAERWRRERKQQHQGSDFHTNPYVEKCSPLIREKFGEVYALLHKSSVSIQALNALIAMVPMLGFKRGCLFLVQKPQMELVPSMRLGDYPTDAYRRLLICDVGIHMALHSLAPYKKEGLGVDGVPGLQICGALGDYQHPGVLYLELAPQSVENPDHDTLLHFHALRQAMIHSFGA